MASIKQSQVEKINGMCANGFRLSIYDYCVRNQKVLMKNIFLNEDQTEKVGCEVYFSDYRNEIIIQYSYSKLNEEKTFWCGKGFGHTEKLAYDKPRKEMKELCKVTSSLSEEHIMNVWKANEIKMRNY